MEFKKQYKVVTLLNPVKGWITEASLSGALNQAADEGYRLHTVIPKPNGNITLIFESYYSQG